MGFAALPYEKERHRPELARIWRENLPDLEAPIDWRMRWLHDDNPAGPATTYVAVAAPSDAPIGCATYYPRALVIDGVPVRAGIACDFAVDKPYRVAQAALTLQRSLARSSGPTGHAFLFGLPNERSIAVCKRIGYAPVGTTVRWSKPLSIGDKLDRKLPRALARAARPILDVMMRTTDHALATLLGRGASFEFVDMPDARFDRLWERARPTRGIVGERTASYLAWRYGANATKHRFVCLTRDGGEEIAGYAAFRVTAEQAVVLDVFGEDFERTSDALMLGLAQQLRAEGIPSLSLVYVGPESFGRRLQRLGFFRRPGGRQMIAYVDPSAEARVKAAVFDLENWFVLEGELDV